MQKESIGTGKMIATGIAAIVILIAAQTLALLVGNLPVMIGFPVAAGNVVAGIAYPVLAFAGIKIWVSGCLKQDMQRYKMARAKPRMIWCCAAIIMPCMVYAIVLCFVAGQWEVTPMRSSEIWETVTGGIFFYGIGAGLVEEMIFRGLIMSALEYRWNQYVAIAIPSILFAVLHIAGNPLSFTSFVQLLIAGSIVGILFSLVTYESGNVWNSAIMHGIWNMMVIGGILHIGGAADTQSIYSYVLNTKSFLITGGDFGIEASIVSILAYVVFILLAIVLIGRQKKRADKTCAARG